MAKKKSAAIKRRSGAEVEELVRKASAAVDGGMQVQEACDKYDLAGSVFRRVASKLGITSSAASAGKVSGSVRADSLPPRPKKKGGRGGPRMPKVVNENDVGSLASRVSQLDRKLAGVTEMQKERKRLAAKLLKLLQGEAATPE